MIPVLRIVAGILILSIASQITVPMAPVPMTLQSLAVLTIGTLLGWRLALVTILIWLAIAALGAPVLADASGGWQRFVGPTAGYLVAFPVAGALAGWIAERFGKSLTATFGAHLVGHAILLGLGVGWLQTSIGWSDAISGGATPFIPGMIVKSAAGALIVLAVSRLLTGRRAETST